VSPSFTELARRSIVRTLRQPAVVAQGIVFPLFLYAFSIGGLSLATKLPGFPTRSYATFALALTFTFIGLYSMTVAGAQVGEDLRTGFIRRVTLTQMRSTTLLLAQLGGVAVLAVCQAGVFLIAGFIAGASVAAGPGGAILIVAFCAFYAVALGSIGLVVALVTRSGEAVQAVFPLLIAVLFFSSLNLPRELIQTTWFRNVATFNPVSYLIEAPRSLLVTGWDGKPLILGFAVASAILLSGLIYAAGSVRSLSVAR
jgi:ABC-2 type transport system permease protein